MDAILFLLFAAIAVVCGLNLVLQSHPISSALSLVGVMGSLAVLYLLLGGEFIAAAQLIVYAGAIMVLFIFVIMLLNAGTELKTTQDRLLKATLDVTPWMEWFVACLGRAIDGAQSMLAGVLAKARFWERLQGVPLNERQTVVLNRLLLE